jgi:hypothetical protein
MSIAIITHDPLDDSVPLCGEFWADITAAFGINFVFKVGGEQAKHFVPFGPEHNVPSKIVCVMTPAEALDDKIETVNLSDYTHPDECTYVFGPDTDVRGWHREFSGPDTDYISITTPEATELYTFNAAAFVLGSRFGIL